MFQAAVVNVGLAFSVAPLLETGSITLFPVHVQSFTSVLVRAGCVGSHGTDSEYCLRVSFQGYGDMAAIDCAYDPMKRPEAAVLCSRPPRNRTSDSVSHGRCAGAGSGACGLAHLLFSFRKLTRWYPTRERSEAFTAKQVLNSTSDT